MLINRLQKMIWTIIWSSGAMKDAINSVAEKLSLPAGWLNTDFVKTDSYTPRLVEHSKYYRTFLEIYKTDEPAFTELVNKTLIKTIIENSGLTAQHEYFRIDTVGWMS